MTFLILKMAALLVVACALGYGLAVYRFKRTFTEVDDDEVAAARAESTQLAAERDELQIRLDAESARQRTVAERAERLKAQLTTTEQALHEQTAAVESVNERIEAALAELREENRSLTARMTQRESEVQSLRTRLASAEQTIKRKTDLLRLSETDLAKGALRQSYRPSDSRPPMLTSDEPPPSRSASSVPPLPSSLRSMPPEPVRDELAKARSLASLREAELERMRAELAELRGQVDALKVTDSQAPGVPSQK